MTLCNRYFWKHKETGVNMIMTTDDMRQAYDAIGIYSELLANMLTGCTCVTYVDDFDRLMEGTNGDLEDYDEETYNRCRVYHRLLHITLSDEDCDMCWAADCQG